MDVDRVASTDSRFRPDDVQALDTFNTAIVSPIYYVMFTTLTILASVIMFKVSPPDAVLEKRRGASKQSNRSAFQPSFSSLTR